MTRKTVQLPSYGWCFKVTDALSGQLVWFLTVQQLGVCLKAPPGWNAKNIMQKCLLPTKMVTRLVVLAHSGHCYCHANYSEKNVDQAVTDFCIWQFGIQLCPDRLLVCRLVSISPNLTDSGPPPYFILDLFLISWQHWTPSFSPGAQVHSGSSQYLVTPLWMPANQKQTTTT